MDKKINKRKILILVSLVSIAIIVTASILLYTKVSVVRSFFDEYIFRKNVTENTLPKIYAENNSIYVFNDYTVCLDKNVLHFYNKLGNEVSSLELEISNPLFVSSNKYLCVAQKNGNKVYLIDGKNVIWQKDFDGKISSISINANGYIAISLSDTTYTTICKVFDSAGSELFTTYHSKTYVVKTSISNDNKYLALAEINFSGIAIQSNIKVISIEKALSNSADTIVYTYEAPTGDFITNLQYCGSNLVCLYDNHLDIIKDNSVSEITNFETSNVLFADINNNLIQIEKVSNGLLNSYFELQAINSNDLSKKTYSINKEPKSIEVFDNVIALNFGTEALFINNSGWLIKKYTSNHEIQSISISNNVAAIIFKDKIEILDL